MLLFFYNELFVNASGNKITKDRTFYFISPNFLYYQDMFMLGLPIIN